MDKKKESGAIVIEATISLTAFIFLMFTILMMVDICYVQAKIGTSLDTAAKEISQYAFLYYKVNLDEAQANAAADAAASKEIINNTISGVNTFIDSMSEAGSSASGGDFNAMMQSINNGTQSVESIITMYGKELEDPKAFIMGMAGLAVSEGTEMAKNEVFGKLLGRSLMKKNLVVSSSDNADNFLKRNKVVNGLDGLDFTYTSLMAYGESNVIRLTVTYEVKVIQLLNIDFKFKFTQSAKTHAWGNGVSLIEPHQEQAASASTVWDLGSTTRGKTIVLEEKKNYTYTSSGNGYDAYNNADGANEFVTIVSINTHDNTYNEVSGIKNRMSAVFNSMTRGVSALGEEIKVTTADGTETTVNSPVDTRTYKVVVVVPDDADMSLVEQAKQQFIDSKSSSGVHVEVEIKTGYGSPTPKQDTA